MCQEEYFGEKIIEKCYEFLKFMNFQQKNLSDFEQKIFGRVVETAFCVSRGTFVVKNFIEKCAGSRKIGKSPEKKAYILGEWFWMIFLS